MTNSHDTVEFRSGGAPGEITDRREVARQFRVRLKEAMTRVEISRSALASRVGIDRSTLSQLLSDGVERLPRADTVAAIAATLQVSLDWLLGLSHETRLGADILHESVEISPSAGNPVDEGLVAWHEAARGYKIRHVPTTLPDLGKTDAVTRHEYRDFASKSADQALAAAEDKLAYSRMPETDMEICMPVHNMADFSAAEGIWKGLSVEARRDQLDRLIRLTGELYPTLRLFLYDALTHYSVPLTVFGPQRAAIYVGQMYFVFNTTEHIRVLTRHFDGLIRAAVVSATEVPHYLTELREKLG